MVRLPVPGLILALGTSMAPSFSQNTLRTGNPETVQLNTAVRPLSVTCWGGKTWTERGEVTSRTCSTMYWFTEFCTLQRYLPASSVVAPTTLSTVWRGKREGLAVRRSWAPVRGLILYQV